MPLAGGHTRRFGTAEEVAASLLDFVRPTERIPELVERQLAAFAVWETTPRCGYRSQVSGVTRALVGTECSCPKGRPEDGVGCLRAQAECPTACRYEQQVARLERLARSGRLAKRRRGERRQNRDPESRVARVAGEKRSSD